MCVFILKVPGLVFLIELYLDRYSECTNEDKTYLTSSSHQPTHEQDQKHFRQTKICGENWGFFDRNFVCAKFWLPNLGETKYAILGYPICEFGPLYAPFYANGNGPNPNPYQRSDPKYFFIPRSGGYIFLLLVATPTLNPCPNREFVKECYPSICYPNPIFLSLPYAFEFDKNEVLQNMPGRPILKAISGSRNCPFASKFGM